MYKPTGFVPDIYLTIFIYSSHWAGGLLSHQIHNPDIFIFYSLAPTLNQAEEAEQFGPPRDLGGFSSVSSLWMITY